MDYSHPLAKTLDAAEAGELGGLSTGEALMAALALNRADWLAKMGYTLVEAFERIGPDWQRMLPAVARAAAEAMSERARARALDAQERALMGLAGLAAPRTGQASADEEAEPLYTDARLVTTGSAPGYRDATLVFDLAAEGRQRDGQATPLRVELRLRPEDGEAIVRHLREVHALAWSDARGPLDARAGETKPRWIGV